jgi:tRNA(fMet)-specific endonuclease VapC
MRYLLDTNACVRHLKLVKEGKFQSRLSQLNPSEVALCSVVKAELIFGALRSDRVAENLAKLKRFFSRFFSLPFDDAAASAHGKIRTNFGESRHSYRPA